MIAALPHHPVGPSDACDLQFELQVDPKTAERIYELNSLKHAAVEREDYDEAKLLKDRIARLKQVGQRLAQLEAQKQVQHESHDSNHSGWSWYLYADLWPFAD